ncbi:MAG: hypothetical protein PHV33_03980 [Elusimicrobiales bacterium]|nr:hypothetical protein [Elusimicrobiales bacterium]
MKLIITLIAAAFPAAASAQSATPTLDLVQEVSLSAAAAPGLAQARTEAARPFVKPPQYGQPGHDNPGHGVPHANPPQPVHPQHPSHPAQPPHPVHPPNVHPVPPPPPYHPPHNPGWNPNPYYPPNPYPPGYYPPSGPGHQTTSPVVHHPGSGSKWALIGSVLLVVLLVVILL